MFGLDVHCFVRDAAEPGSLSGHTSRAGGVCFLRCPIPTPISAGDFKERDLIVIQGNDELRRKFHVAAGAFTVVLIGKDGGEKLLRTEPISVEELDATIDAMPMRRREMKKH